MAKTKDTLQKIRAKKSILIKGDTKQAQALWKQFIALHPADIADFLTDIDLADSVKLFDKLPSISQVPVFEEFSDMMKLRSLPLMTHHEQIDILNLLPLDEVTDLFDMLSDEELKVYLQLLHKRSREKVLALMQFHPESAGGVMDIEVFSLIEDFTVEKSIQLLRRVQMSKDVYQRIYVTDKNQKLLGYIRLEDLILEQPYTQISSFMKPNEYVAQADEDREGIAKKMVHYGLMIVPVVGQGDHFLGVIPGKTLVDVLVEEASEDLQKMFALAPIKGTYFEMPFWRVLAERSYILVGLLIAQSFSTSIMESYRTSLGAVLLVFVTMLIGAGGNSSNQTSAVVLQGLATGEIRSSNIARFLRREFAMAFILAIVLSVVGYIRAILTTHNVLQSIAIATSLFVIVFVGVILGSVMPLILKRVGIDPAFSAGPFLATLMDILGSFIFCSVSYFVLYLLF